MKQTGIILLILGLIMTVYTGFSYITKDKVVDLGGLEITKDNHHDVNWQPYMGIGVMIIGGVILVLDRKKTSAK